VAGTGENGGVIRAFEMNRPEARQLFPFDDCYKVLSSADGLAESIPQGDSPERTVPWQVAIVLDETICNL
jgi:hypothetical protein